MPVTYIYIYSKRKYATEMATIEPTQFNPKTSPAPNTTSENMHHSSTEMLVEDNDYDQLPAMKPSVVTLADDDDYDQLPVLANTSPHKGKNTGYVNIIACSNKQ